MKNNKYDKYICDLFIIYDKLRINSNQIRKLPKYANIHNYILNRYLDETCISTIIWRIYYNIEIRPKCKICGSFTKFDNKSKQYKKYCCSKCAAKSDERNIKYKETCLAKYGHTNPMNGEQTKLTWIKRYGVDNPMKSDVIKEKSKRTCLKKYGTEYSFQSQNNIQKSKLTKRLKYNNENYVNILKRKQTCIEKYGDDEFINTTYFKEKSKETLLKHYGVDNYFKLPLMKVKAHSTEALSKIIETKRKNGTFNTSKPEDQTYDLLKEKYIDVIRQYKSDKYPFTCDFYIPSLDLYIECNYHWTHGGKPYEETEEDLAKVDKWKDKNTKYYDNAIYTWTIRDVNKRKIAKENKLNWIEFFSILELNEWLK